jgi:hypothetical protein
MAACGTPRTAVEMAQWPHRMSIYRSFWAVSMALVHHSEPPFRKTRIHLVGTG